MILGDRFESDEEESEDRYSFTLSSAKSKAEGCAGELEVRDAVDLFVAALLGCGSICTDMLDDAVDAEDETDVDVERLWSLRRWASFAPSTSFSRKPSILSWLELQGDHCLC